MQYFLLFRINEQIYKKCKQSIVCQNEKVLENQKVKKMCDKLREISGKTAEEILEHSGQIDKIPVNIERIIDSCGININKTDFNEIEQFMELDSGTRILGAVFTDGNELNVCYNSNDYIDELPDIYTSEEKKKKVEHRRYFTLAHELAHCCLHMNPDSDRVFIEFRTDHLNNDNQKEREANIFAGELLIPQKSLMFVYDKLKIKSLEFLADLFNVSRTVMAARLNYLGLYYCSNL